MPAAGSNPTTGGSSGSGGGSDSNFTATAGDPTTAGQPDVNGFGAGLDRNRRDAPTLAPAQGGKARTQRDTGFKETLPFGTATGQGGQGDKEDGADDPNAEQAAAPNGDRGDSAMSIH